MAICNKCGANIDDNATVCPVCNAPQQQAAPNNANPAPVSLDSTDYTASMDPNDIAQNKGMSVLAYFGFLFLVPLLAAPNSRYARFHTNQGLIVFILDAIIGAICAVTAFIPVAGIIISSILPIPCLILAIIGIVNAATGKAKELPILGKFKIIK